MPSPASRTPPFKRASTSVKRKRPGWWTPEGVLSRLQSGDYIMVICQTASDEMAEVGIPVLPSTLRADVTHWCESATWGNQLRAALALWKKTSSGEMVLSTAWHDDFLAAMEACEGNAQKAASMAGVGYGVVLSVLDRRNGCYNQEFAEKFRIAELERMGKLREKYMVMAEEGEGKIAARATERLIETALPGLHGQKQEKEVRVTGKVEHEHDHEHRHLHRHLHSLSPEAAREVVVASQERVRRIVGTRSRDADAGAGMLAQGAGAGNGSEDRVIDLTPIAQRQRQRQETPA